MCFWQVGAWIFLILLILVSFSLYQDEKGQAGLCRGSGRWLGEKEVDRVDLGKGGIWSAKDLSQSDN